MVIEYSNAKVASHHSFVVTLFVVSATVFLFIPTTLIVLGYYSSQPTGNLISPLPQGIISQTPTVTPPTSSPSSQLIVAADNQSTPSSVVSDTSGNSTDHSVILLATKTEVKVEDQSIKADSQILIIPKSDDKSIYFVKSKTDGSFILSTNDPSTFDRSVDYQIVNP